MIRIRTTDDVLTAPLPGDQFFALLEVAGFSAETGELKLIFPDAGDGKRCLSGIGVVTDLRAAAKVGTVYIVRVAQLDTAHLGAELADLALDAVRERQRNPSG